MRWSRGTMFAMCLTVWAGCAARLSDTEALERAMAEADARDREQVERELAPVRRRLESLPVCAEMGEALPLEALAGEPAKHVGERVRLRAWLGPRGSACDLAACMLPVDNGYYSFAVERSHGCCNDCGGIWMLETPAVRFGLLLMTPPGEPGWGWGAHDCTVDYLRAHPTPPRREVVATGTFNRVRLSIPGPFERYALFVDEVCALPPESK
jgi:hypothetical protein